MLFFILKKVKVFIIKVIILNLFLISSDHRNAKKNIKRAKEKLKTVKAK